MYALRFKAGTILCAGKKYQADVGGKLVEFRTSSNGDADFCVSITYSLTEGGDGLWTTSEKKVAEYVASNDTIWYNADFRTPKNPYVGMLEVVELIVKE